MLTNILQSIGRTPLLRLNALGADLPGTVWLKLENRNPGDPSRIAWPSM